MAPYSIFLSGALLTIIIYLYSCNKIQCEYPTFLPQYHGAVSVTNITVNPWKIMEMCRLKSLLTVSLHTVFLLFGFKLSQSHLCSSLNSSASHWISA